MPPSWRISSARNESCSTKSSALLLIRPRSWLGSWTGTRGRVGERLARLVIEALDETGRRERILATFRTAAVEAETARMVGDKFTTELLEPVVSQLGVVQAQLRAALVMSQILGLALARHVVGLEDLTSASQDELVAALAPTLQRYLVGDIS